MDCTKPSRDLVGFLGLVAAGVGLLYLRDPHSLLMPTLYTEDGVWMAKLFNRGFWHTMIHAKGGDTPYFVTLNIVLLQVAKSLNACWFGESLAHLPLFVSGLAMTFYAVVAAAPVWLLRRSLGGVARGLLWGLVVFMPLGDSSFEVLGRVSNIGYGLLFLCLCLMIWRRTADRSRPSAIMAADAAMLVCATTNPLCYPLIAADYAVRSWAVWRRRTSLMALLRASLSARSAAMLAAGLLAAIAGMTLLEPRPNPFLRTTIEVDELIEAVVARPLLYPLLFPWYTRLDDLRAVLLVLGGGGLFWWLTTGAPAERRVVVATGAAAIYAAVATVAVRPGLTHLLEHYATSQLDRYYYGTSLLVAIALAAAVSAGLRARLRPRRLVAGFVGATVVAVYATHAGSLIEFHRSRWPDLPQQDFARAMAAAAATSDDGTAELMSVPLHPQPWKASFPARNVRATALALAPDVVVR